MVVTEWQRELDGGTEPAGLGDAHLAAGDERRQPRGLAETRPASWTWTAGDERADDFGGFGADAPDGVGEL